MDEEPQEPEGEEPRSPMAMIQDAIAAALGDESLLAGYIVLAEWIEDDGSHAMSVIHSPMPPWHLEGLMRYGLRECQPLTPVYVDSSEVDIDFDDEDDE